jgi:phosphatidylserine decarboxylase
MLDSLGSTLSMETIDSFFTRWDKDPRRDELTFPEAIQCLETEICRPNSEKKRIEQNVSDNDGSGRERELETESGTDASVSHTPNLHTLGTHTPPLKLDFLTFSGPAFHIDDPPPSSRHPRPPAAVRQASSSTSAASDTENTENSSPGSGHGARGNDSGNGDEAFERVINIKNCPLCQRPRLNSKAERDIVTHLAVCASQDWARVDHVMVGNFVTSLQAQRKWYTNVLSKVSAGNYKIGAVRGSRSSFSFLTTIPFLEFCEYHRAESDDWSARGREDAGLRAARHSTTVQGE